MPKFKIIYKFYFLLVTLFLAGCQRSNIDLGNGYCLIRSNSEHYSVVQNKEPNIEIIPANIRCYGNEKYTFYGYLHTNEYVKFHKEDGVNYTGYFYLDKKSEFVKFGLSESELSDALKERGILKIKLIKTE